MILCNDFEHFFTLTIDSNKCSRVDIEDSWSIIKGHFKQCKKANKDFKYIIVAEYHGDNQSIHYHGVMYGYPFSISGTSISFFNSHLGFSNVSKIKDKQRVSSYILKYITKDMVPIGGCYYSSSRNMRRPVVLDAYLDDVYSWDYCSKTHFYSEKWIKKHELVIYLKQPSIIKYEHDVQHP